MSAQIPAFSELDFGIIYTTGAAGTGSITASATSTAGSGSDMLTVNVQGSLPPGAPIVAVTTVNPGTLLERSACVTTGAGAFAVFQCGDLLLPHAMPSYRTLDTDRTLTLLYNSATASPKPVIMADVSLSATVGRPDSVRAILSVNSVQQATAWFSAASLDPGGAAQRIALSFDGASLATGVHSYSLTVENHYAGSPTQSTVGNGEFVVVNRLSSPYGAGWSVAGVEKLVLSQRNGALMLTQADGSAAVYETVATNTWLAPAGAYRDTIFFGGATDPSGAAAHYWRRALDGTRVFYDSSGRQIWVQDRVNNAARYNYGTGDALTSIVIAPQSALKQYTFEYDGVGKLDHITDPAARRLEATVTSGNLTALLDPGLATGQEVTFTYSGNLLQQRRSQRLHTTAYAYVTGTTLLQSVTLPATAAGTAVISFIPVQRRGLAVLPSLNAMEMAIYASVEVNGPRTDVTDKAFFYVNRFNAPVRIATPAGDSTSIRYSSTHPLLPDSLRQPDGRIVRLTYDASARVTKSEDLTHSSGSPAVVTYAYRTTSPAREAPDTIRTPRQAGTTDTTSFVFNGNGTVQSIRDARGNVTTYTYNTAGQPTEITNNSVSYWQGASRITGALTHAIRYDVLGNIDTVRTPMGNATRFRYDGYANVRTVVQPTGDSVRTAFSILNRPDTIIQYDTAGSYRTTHTYDPEGNLTQRCDPRLNCRNYIYDAVSQMTSMTDEFNFSETRRYDIAGNLTVILNRQRDSVTTEYDVMNRPQKRILREIKVDSDDTPTAYNRAVGTVLIPVDTLTFAYDAMSRITVAGNRVAQTRRTYTREGAIATDTQEVKFPNTTRGLSFTYHPSGARRTMTTPSQLYDYTYNPGPLLRGVSWSGSGVVNYRYDQLGRPDSMWITGVASTAYHYDMDGRSLRLLTNRPDGTKLVKVIYEQYDANGRPLSVVDSSSRFSGSFQRRMFAYDGRDQLIRLGVEGSGAGHSRFVYDSLGNRSWELKACNTQYISCRDTTQFVHYLSNGRVTSRVGRRLSWISGQSIHEDHTYFYDKNGNQIRDAWIDVGFTDDLDRFYNAADQLQATQPTTLPQNVFFLYDALGRRLRGTAGDSASLFFYDGENIIRYGSGDYLHGLATDNPLVAFMPLGNICPGTGNTETAYYTTLGNRLFDFYGGSGPSCISDSSGNIFGPWQGWGSHSGAILNSETFGLQRSSGTRDRADLSFFRNRFYDARTGRFLQEDPVQFIGGLNLYAYAGNNPASYTDPFGLCPPEKTGRPCGVFEPGHDAMQSAGVFDVVAWGSGLAGGIRAAAGRLLGRSAAAASEGAGVQFAQRGISSTFRHGEFAGQSLQSVAAGLRSGAISPNQLPINVVVRNGVSYTMNNRSLMALRMAGLKPTAVKNVTGNPFFERQLTERLAEMAGSASATFTPVIR